MVVRKSSHPEHDLKSRSNLLTENSSPIHGGSLALLALMFSFLTLGFAALPAFANVDSVTIQSPALEAGNTVNLTSPVHFQVTAESDLNVTGYVVYVDSENVYQNHSVLADAWVVLGPGIHSVYVKAWDSSGNLASTETYSMNVIGFAPPTPPINATLLPSLSADPSMWTVDNGQGVGGQCNDGTIEPFTSTFDPNTANSPDMPNGGLHEHLTSKCQYDDSLFYRKASGNFAGNTNFLWDFWFYIPTTTRESSIQALESDLYQAVQLSDGVHEFMFGSQCNYIANQWQIWLPSNGRLTWMNAGTNYPCRFSAGTWHHAIYYLQRVTPSGYQNIPASFSPSTDLNSSLRFGTLTIDGATIYLGGLSYSTIPNPHWSPTLGIQHQLDSAESGITIDEYMDKDSLTTW